jgi:DNA-binding transcriptional MerR regulator
MEDIEYKIYKYELCPVDDPDRIVVGFLITDTTNGKSLNIEEIATLLESAGKDQEEVCQLVYDKIKDRIEALKQKLLSKRESVVGKIFLPSV